jgi:anti-anti-sigma regulatory factor
MKSLVIPEGPRHRFLGADPDSRKAVAMANPPRHIQVRHLGDVTVVGFNDLESKVSDPEVVSEIGEELFNLAEAGRAAKVLLDFGGAPFIPYAMFEGTLVSLQRRVEAAGGVLKMANLHHMVRDHFHMNRLDTCFRIYDSEEEAVGAFTC